MKKPLCLILTIALLLPALFVPAAAFDDVRAGAWYAEAVDYVVSAGLFQGTGENTFTPNGTMTRGMFVTVLGRMAGAPTSFTAAGEITKAYVNLRAEATTDSEKLDTLDKGTALEVLGMEKGWYRVRCEGQTGYVRSDLMRATIEGMTDVPYGKYYAPYVCWARQCGIADGTTDITFAPEEPISREDICISLTRYCSYYGLVLPTVRESAAFTDEDEIGDLDAVHALQRAGIIEGRDTGAFDPRASVQRCEVAALFQRYGQCGAAAPEPDDPAGTYSGYALFGNIAPETAPAADSYFDDACFIGHSLVVGMKNYFALRSADFFAVSGISAKRMLSYDRFVLDETYEDENGETQNRLGTLADALRQKQYGKVYVMLGVNELGPKEDHLSDYYNSMLKLVDLIRTAQPGARIYLISITPITQKRSSESTYFNRENVIRFNDALQQVSLEKDVYYVDVFLPFADAQGYMPSDAATADGIHLPAAKYADLKRILATHAN